MYAIVTKETRPPRISRGIVDPRCVIEKKRSRPVAKFVEPVPNAATGDATALACVPASRPSAPSCSHPSTRPAHDEAPGPGLQRAAEVPGPAERRHDE
ncbi:hypothetical protein IAE22_29490 [Bacillus sp. S34]|nr:hypothetical protein [Bacillus sp. S34]